MPPYGYPPAGPPPGWGAQQPGFYPLDLGRNFQLSWSLFRYSWRTLLGIGLVVLLPAYAFIAAASAVYSPVINGWVERVELATRAGLPPPPVPTGFYEAIAVLSVLSIVLLFVSLLASGAATVSVDRTFRGAPTSIGAALSRASGKYLSLLGAELLYFLVAFGIMLVGLVIGGVLMVGGGAAIFLGLIVIVAAFAALLFVAVRAAFIVQTITLENAGAVEGFSRSWRLASGSGWRVFGYVLLIGLIATIVGAIVQALSTILLRLDPNVPSSIVIGTFTQAVGAILLLPLTPLVLTLLYYDLRWRRGEPAPLPGDASRVESAAAPTVPGS